MQAHAHGSDWTRALYSTEGNGTGYLGGIGLGRRSAGDLRPAPPTEQALRRAFLNASARRGSPRLAIAIMTASETMHGRLNGSALLALCADANVACAIYPDRASTVTHMEGVPIVSPDIYMAPLGLPPERPRSGS